ncbi:MAG: cysteine--tRNA ligase, partial [Runella slithyformis]
HPLLEQAYSPMSVRFFMLQSQYRSTLDFSNDALKGAQKAYKRLVNGLKSLKQMVYIPAEITHEPDEAGLKVSTPGVEIDVKKVADIEKSVAAFYEAMNDDLNTAVAVAQVFNLLKYINMLYLNQLTPAALGEAGFGLLKEKFVLFFEQILGLQEEKSEGDAVLNGMLELYRTYKAAQAYDKVDEIRTYFKAQGLVIRDMKHRIDWAYEE